MKPWLAVMFAATAVIASSCTSDPSETASSEVATTVEAEVTIVVSTASTSSTEIESADTTTAAAADTTSTSASADATGPVLCEYSTSATDPNPFGMRSFLRFEDRAGGSAIVFEGFGNAIGDGAQARQAVFEGEGAADLYARFVAGEPVADDVLGGPLDEESIAQLAAGFSCGPIEGALPTWVGFVGVLPGDVVSTCEYDPAKGINPLGMRASFRVEQLEGIGAGTFSVGIYETFGNAAGDGASWYQTAFDGMTAAEALAAFVGDTSHYSEATGDTNAGEVQALLDQMSRVYTCS